MLQLLIEQGAMLDIRDASGSSALHLALEAQVGYLRGSEGLQVVAQATVILAQSTLPTRT